MDIEIWSKENCSYCDQAKRWFARKGFEFVEHKIGHNGVTREKLLERVPEARTVPQIFIDGKLIGGWDDLKKTEFFLGQ